MEPETSAPKLEPEKAPIEHGPERSLPVNPERGLLDTGTERTEQTVDKSELGSDQGVVSTTTTPTTVTSDDDITTDDQSTIAAPVNAADDDLIEKEWVDRAKKIVADTRNDPYKQENAVTELQKDYQKKRYGRELGEAS